MHLADIECIGCNRFEDGPVQFLSPTDPSDLCGALHPYQWPANIAPRARIRIGLTAKR